MVNQLGIELGDQGDALYPLKHIETSGNRHLWNVVSLKANRYPQQRVAPFLGIQRVAKQAEACCAIATLSMERRFSG
jgi:hypothetical protein